MGWHEFVSADANQILCIRRMLVDSFWYLSLFNAFEKAGNDLHAVLPSVHEYCH
jgi:hypothetical protein